MNDKERQTTTKNDKDYEPMDESDALESSSVAPKWVPTIDLRLSASML